MCALHCTSHSVRSSAANMCVRLLSLFPLWTGAVSGPGVKFDGAQVSVRELLLGSKDTCGILVRDPGAKPVVPFAVPGGFVDSFSAKLDVKFDCYDVVLVPEPGRCFELCPVVFSDPSQLAWLLQSTMVFPSGACFHAMDCVSSLVLDAFSSWDLCSSCASAYCEGVQSQRPKANLESQRRSILSWFPLSLHRFCGRCSSCIHSSCQGVRRGSGSCKLLCVQPLSDCVECLLVYVVLRRVWDRGRSFVLAWVAP